MAHWAGQLGNGLSLSQIEAAIKNSPEAKAKAQGKAEGGWISGGSPGSDSVPIVAMPGEFMVKQRYSARFGGALEAINSGRNPFDARAVVDAIQGLGERVDRLTMLTARAGDGNLEGLGEISSRLGALETKARRAAAA